MEIVKVVPAGRLVASPNSLSSLICQWQLLLLASYYTVIYPIYRCQTHIPNARSQARCQMPDGRLPKSVDRDIPPSITTPPLEKACPQAGRQLSNRCPHHRSLYPFFQSRIPVDYFFGWPGCCQLVHVVVRATYWKSISDRRAGSHWVFRISNPLPLYRAFPALPSYIISCTLYSRLIIVELTRGGLFFLAR